MSSLAMTSDNSEQNNTDQIPVRVTLSKDIVELLDQLKVEYGARTRGRVIEMLLRDLISPEE